MTKRTRRNHTPAFNKLLKKATVSRRRTAQYIIGTQIHGSAGSAVSADRP